MTVPCSVMRGGGVAFGSLAFSDLLTYSFDMPVGVTLVTSLAGAGAGYVLYTMHKPNEEKRQMYQPSNYLQKFKKGTWAAYDYVLSGINFGAGLVAIGATLDNRLLNDFVRNMENAAPHYYDIMSAASITLLAATVGYAEDITSGLSSFLKKLKK